MGFGKEDVQGGIAVIYAYVLLDDCFMFSPAGKSLVVDLMSKVWGKRKKGGIDGNREEERVLGTRKWQRERETVWFFG